MKQPWNGSKPSARQFVSIVEDYTTALAAYWLYPYHDILSVGSTTNLVHATTNFELRYGTDKLVIDADGDEAGKQAAWNAYKRLGEQNILPMIIQRPSGDAADELCHLLRPTTPHPDPQNLNGATP